MAAKPTKVTKIHDISHPGTHAASPTSRPVIISNRPVLKDPMMRDTDTISALPDSSPAAEVPTVSKKIKIEPLHTDLTVVDDTTQVDTLPEAEAVVATTGDDKPAVLVLDPAPAADAEPAPDTVKEEEAGKEPEAAKAPAETPATPPKADGDQKVGPKPEEKTAEEARETTTTTDEAAEENTKDAPTGDLANLDMLDEAAVKEARAAAEKQHAFDKLVEQETYFLPINTVEKRRMKRVLLGVLLVFVVLIAAVAIDLLLDAGLISLGDVQPLTDFIHS